MIIPISSLHNLDSRIQNYLIIYSDISESTSRNISVIHVYTRPKFYSDTNKCHMFERKFLFHIIIYMHFPICSRSNAKFPIFFMVLPCFIACHFPPPRKRLCHTSPPKLYTNPRSSGPLVNLSKSIQHKAFPNGGSPPWPHASIRGSSPWWSYVP